MLMHTKIKFRLPSIMAKYLSKKKAFALLKKRVSAWPEQKFATRREQCSRAWVRRGDLACDGYAGIGGGMHCSVHYILSFAMFFGVFPVTGITHRDIGKLSFRWCSPQIFYTLILLMGFIVVEALALQYSAHSLNQTNLTSKGGLKRATSGAIFYGNALVECWLFLQLAKAWPSIAFSWQCVEHKMQGFPAPRLLLRFVTTSLLFMALAFSEHGLHNWLNTRDSDVAEVNRINSTALTELIDAFNSTGINQGSTAEKNTILQYLERFYVKTHWFLLSKRHPYTVWKGVFIVWISTSATFLWNFTDLFIMLVSSGLAAQFKVFNKSLALIRGKNLTPHQWREYREVYTALTHLVKLVDLQINKIIMLSISSNVYFICAQLITEIDSIVKDDTPSLFYMYSFFVLVARTSAVVMQAAAINDESLLVVPELFLCPAQSYCSEVQRFLHEVSSDHVYLTGYNMFAITRNFLLGVSGAILTYEIVLIQLEISK